MHVKPHARPCENETLFSTAFETSEQDAQPLSAQKIVHDDAVL